jgi:hypothetical protein
MIMVVATAGDGDARHAWWSGRYCCWAPSSSSLSLSLSPSVSLSSSPSAAAAAAATTTTTRERECVCAWAIGVARWLADGQTADTGLPLRDCIVKRRYARLGRGFLSPTALGDKNRRATRRHIHGGPLCQPCEPTKAFRVPCLVCGVACAAAVIGSRHVSAWLPRHTMP